MFFIGVVFALQVPAWSAIVPDLVTDEELLSAATLGGAAIECFASLSFDPPPINCLMMPPVNNP